MAEWQRLEVHVEDGRPRAAGHRGVHRLHVTYVCSSNYCQLQLMQRAKLLLICCAVAFGLVIAGAAGFGVYTLYQRFLGPYRSHFRSSSDPFSNVSSNIDTLNDMFSRSRRRTKSAVQDDLGSLVQGMPLIVRGFVKTVFSFLGKAMQSSMERAGELRRRTNEHLQANKRVRDQMGDNVSVGGPEQWMESST